MRSGGQVRVAGGAVLRRRSAQYGVVVVAMCCAIVGGSLVASASRSPRGSTGGPARLVGLSGHVISMSVSGVRGVGVTNGPGNLEALSFTWGIATPKVCGGCGRAAGRPTYENLTIKRSIDAASPVLSRDCAMGKPITSVILYVTPTSSGSGSQDSLAMTFKDVIITDDDWNVVTANDEMPIETLAMSYRSYAITYNPMPAATTTTTTTTTTSTTTTTTTTTVPPVTYVPTTTSPTALG